MPNKFEVSDKVVYKDELFYIDGESDDKEEPCTKTAGVVVNLFDSKGDSVFCEVRYLSGGNFGDKKNLPKGLEGKLLITDHLDGNLYPKISALGVRGIIANSIDYSLYREIIILTVPLGVISGFGNLKEDQKLVKYFKSKEGESVCFDAVYKRLILPESKSPAWIKNYRHTIQSI